MIGLFILVYVIILSKAALGYVTKKNGYTSVDYIGVGHTGLHYIKQGYTGQGNTVVMAKIS
jgi:hypothetical protein